MTPIEQAIQDFKSESFVDCYGDTIAVADLVDPDLAMGNCDEVARLFVAFLEERGIYGAEVIMTEDATSWGYQGTTRYGAPTEHGGIHYAVRYGWTLIDWTACQFIGQTESPVVRGI